MATRRRLPCFSPLLLAAAGLSLVFASTHGFVLAMALKTPKPTFGGIAHAGILVSNTQASLNFYLRTLGFEDDTHMRPSTLPFPGAFVRGGAQQIHLMELPNPDPTRGRPEHGGRDRHVAFTVEDIEPLLERLKEGGVPFTMSKSGRRAVFCRDPDGNALEFMEEQSVGTMKEGEKEDL